MAILSGYLQLHVSSPTVPLEIQKPGESWRLGGQGSETLHCPGEPRKAWGSVSPGIKVWSCLVLYKICKPPREI